MGIEITIRAGVDEGTSHVNASGSVQHVITDKEMKAFGFGDTGLKNAVYAYTGQWPNDASLRKSESGLYGQYNWPEVQTVLVVKSATVTGITSEPTIVATKTLANNSRKRATFNAGISDQVANTTETNWSETETIEVGQSFSYDVSFLGAGGGGETSMSYSQEWGKGGSESRETTVGSDSGLSVELEPGESVESQLTASRGVMKVRIVYMAYPTGATAVNYEDPYNGHHYWGFDIGSVMGKASLPSTKEFIEDIEIGYYSNSRIELTDPQGQSAGALNASDRAARPVA